MLRELFRERLKELAAEAGTKVGEDLSPIQYSFKDLVNRILRELERKVEENLESQTDTLLNMFIITISELLVFRLKNLIEQLKEEEHVLGALKDDDILAALITVLNRLWDKKIERRILQIKHFPPDKREELKAKFIQRIVRRFMRGD